MRRITIVLLIAAALSLHAAGKARIRALNVGGQAVMTVIRGVAQRSISGWDVAKAFTAGAGAGYGFYEAKRLIASDHVTAGWLLANAAASVTENAASGKHPFAQLGYTIGPLRFRASIPRFDPKADSYLFVDAYVYEAGALFNAHRENDRTHFSSGLISFEKKNAYAQPGPSLYQDGDTFGAFPGVWRGIRLVNPAAPMPSWHHEIIHAVQSIQADSVEPRLPASSGRPRRARGGA